MRTRASMVTSARWGRRSERWAGGTNGPRRWNGRWREEEYDWLKRRKRRRREAALRSGV